MDDLQIDLNRELMLDGNALAGLLREMFNREMTSVPASCAHCGNRAEMGALQAYTQAPGAVLRCPVCEGIVLRVAVTEKWVYLDARGASFIRLER